MASRSDKTWVYIDGFNLYYGAIRHNGAHWLNLAQMCRRLLKSHHAVEKIKYFTAMVSDTPDDPGKSIRQGVYHRALRTLPEVEIILGQFRTQQVSRPVSVCSAAPTCFTQVTNREEKGSDVNLAVHLLHDAHLGRFDTAVVVSEDSDLVEPVRMVSQELGKNVGVINPRTRRPRELALYATFYRVLRRGVLLDSQFPASMTDARGSFRKPAEWSSGRPAMRRREIGQLLCPHCHETVKVARLEAAKTSGASG